MDSASLRRSGTVATTATNATNASLSDDEVIPDSDYKDVSCAWAAYSLFGVLCLWPRSVL